MNEIQSLEVDVLAPSVTMMLERAVIDSQIATAHQFPRSLEKFKRRALEMVTLDEETAESCIYARPVGKGANGQQTFAEGASIRLAEIVASCYGNIRVAARVIEQNPRFVKCEGVAHDLESNSAGKSEVVEATVKRDGTPYDERMRAVIAKAALSKAYRDAVFRVVPKALCKTIIDAAKKIATGEGKTLDSRRGKAQLWIATLKTKEGRKLEEKRVFAALGVAGWSEVGEDHLLMLIGLRTSIGDNEVTVDEAFPPPAGTEAPPVPSIKVDKEKKAKVPTPGEFWKQVEEKGIPIEDVDGWLVQAGHMAEKGQPITQAMLDKVNLKELFSDLTV